MKKSGQPWLWKKKIIYHSNGKQYTKSLKKQKKKCIENKSKVVKKKEKLQKMAGDQSKGLWRREK